MVAPLSRAAKTFGERVRAERAVLGASQEELAEGTGLHWTTIGKIERGERNLSLHNIVRIAAGLGVNPGELVADLSDDDLPERPPTVSGIERLKLLREQQGR